MPPLISIVIPTYNRARDLNRAVKSVLAQTYPHWEALIVDNHSTDGTAEVVRGFNDPRIRLLPTLNEGVIAASRNLGIRHADGEYVAFLDSDDWWVPQKLARSLAYLARGAELVYHDLFLVTKPDQRFVWRKARTRNLSSPVFDDLIINGNCINTSSVVVSRRLLRSIEGFSEDRALVAAEDYDAWLRAARVSEAFVRIPETLGYYWLGTGNTTNPARTIATLQTIEGRFADALVRLRSRRSPYWLSYVQGRAYYLLGSYEMARTHLALVRRSGTPWPYLLKSRWMLLSIAMLHRSTNSAQSVP